MEIVVKEKKEKKEEKKEEIKEKIGHVISIIQEIRNDSSVLTFPSFMCLGDAIVDLNVAKKLL